MFRDLMFKTAILILTISGCLLGCGGDSDDDPLPGEPADFADHFKTTPYGVPECDTREGRLKGQREVRLFRNGISDVKPFTRALQRYFDRHELQFFTRFAPQTVSTSYALNTNLKEIERDLKKQFPNVDFDADLDVDSATAMAVLRAVANLLLKPMVSFAEIHGKNGTSQTNFVFLPQLVRPGGDDILKLGPGKTLVGLAISPALIARFAKSSLAEAAIWEGVSFPENFTPMVFLDAKVLNAFTEKKPVLLDLTMAHEFGHTGALVHREESENLMLAGVDANTARCTEKLLPDQIATLQQSLAVGTATAPRPLAQTLTTDPQLPSRKVVNAHYRELRAFLAGTSKQPPSFLRALYHPVALP